MMKIKICLLPSWLSIAVASSVLLPVAGACAQTAPAGVAPTQAVPSKTAPADTAPVNAAPAQAAPAKPASANAAAPVSDADRAQAYYHLALANSYEEDAATLGRPELVTQAIEEYKLALNADPASPQLNDGLADLYFRTGRVREAESTARELLKNSPNDADAHKLLGRIFLRALSEDQNAPSSASPSGNVLDQAIAEYEKIVSLEPKSVEDRMVLGQLYVVKHDQKKAEEQFKTAQAIDPDGAQPRPALCRERRHRSCRQGD
jgi:tetratricopeptide (TPR) repeat protein